MLQTADALLGYAEDLLDARRLIAALAQFNAAQTAGASPDCCAAGRWMAWMLLGNFEEAWRESDAIRRRGAPDPHRFWNGEDIRCRDVVLRCLHGFGDAVQMLRFCPQIADRCSSLTVEVPPRLLELAPCFEGVERVITWGALAPEEPARWDVQLEIMELPYFFRTTRHQLPIATKYLHVPTLVERRVSGVMGSRRAPRVGIVWAAGDWNPARSLPLFQMQPLLETAGCEFWNLQGGLEHRTEWEELQGRKGHRDAAECGDGILTLAAVIEQLDLVITVDTLAAHLAGALGKPAWVLLEHVADWRWMEGHPDSPWYPSLKLYRQNTPENWPSIIEHVRVDLSRWLNCEQHVEMAG